MATEFWLETESGQREALYVNSMDEALAIARRLYPDPATDDDPDRWLFKTDHDGDEDYVLVPGGPECEEFTWMQRSWWKEGGILGGLL